MSRSDQKWLSLLPLALVTALAISPAVSAQVPGLMESRDDGARPPVWVSAHAAADSQGQMRWNLFGIAAWHSLQYGLRNVTAVEPPGPGHDLDPEQASARQACRAISTTWTVETTLPMTTLEDFARHSVGIVSGTVKSRTPGFLDGVPVTLLALEPFRVSKSLGDFVLREVYVAYPEAAFWAAGHPFCSSVKGIPELPRVGDAMLAVTYSYPPDQDGNIVQLLPTTGLFVQRPHAPIETARAFEGKKRVSQIESIDALSKLLESLMSGGS